MMRTWLHAAWSASLFLAAALAAPLAPEALAGDVELRFVATPSTAESADSLRDLLQRGRQLQLEQRWGEALTLYEDAAKLYPGDRDVERGLQQSRLQYDLTRRYGDASFRDTLVTLSERKALDLYAEVLLMIQSHHVDAPNWRKLVDQGTTSFEVATTAPVFVRRHLQKTPQNTIDRMFKQVRAWTATQRITNRQEARDVVAAIGRLARDQIGVSSSAVILEYLCGATNSLDEYSCFLTGDQLAETYAQIEGNFVGLGVELKADDGALLVVKVIPRSPAERGGLRAGDRIVGVNGQSIIGQDTEEAADLLQGPEGSTVDVSVIAPGGAERVLRMRRAQIDVPSIDDVRMLDAQNGVGYLRLTCFQKTTSKDLDAALENLSKQGMTSLIMDLRGNPGGLLTASVDVSNKFVDRGTIVSTRGRIAAEQHDYHARSSGTWKIPLVVLIDGDSASASEIFAGCMRDLRRGTIVGSRSYGKGSVQGIFALERARAGLRLTTSKFYSPNGLPYSRVGVDPDVVVQQAARPVDGAIPSTDGNGDDPVVQAGLEVVLQKLARR
jgi:carboxyl-terminal processing protease